ncbi:MAG: HypC/HybG/HupF family hydrogenase formation chaperone [Gemmatimonadota bacterium]
MCLGIPGKILDIRDEGPLATGRVDFGGVRRDVCLAYVADEVEPGDYVIVHVGFAIARVDEKEARRTFEALREMSELDELDWIREVAETSLAGTEPLAPTGTVGEAPVDAPPTVDGPAAGGREETA